VSSFGGRTANTAQANNSALATCHEEVQGLSEKSSVADRLAVGLAMIHAGSSINFAAQKVSLRTETLRQHAYREGMSLEARRERFAEQEDMAVRKSFEILTKAMIKAEELLESDRMRPSEVVKLIQATTTLLSSKLRWGAPDPPPPEPEKEKSVMEKILERLESGQKLSVSKEPVERPVYELAEVVPDGEDDEGQGRQEG
jgi:hypothetical protein